MASLWTRLRTKCRWYSSHLPRAGALCDVLPSFFYSRKPSHSQAAGKVSAEFQYPQGFPNQIVFGDKQPDAVGCLRNGVASLCHNDVRRQDVALMKDQH